MRIILKWILNRKDGMVWRDVDAMLLAQDRYRWRDHEHGDEPSGFVTGGEFLKYL
jgi:hypothetical protein